VTGEIGNYLTPAWGVCSGIEPKKWSIDRMIDDGIFDELD